MSEVCVGGKDPEMGPELLPVEPQDLRTLGSLDKSNQTSL